MRHERRAIIDAAMAETKGASGPLQPPRERRRATRHPAKLPAYLEVADDEEQHLGLVENISVSGTVLLTRAVFELADSVLIKLYMPDGIERSASGRVVRSDKVIDDRADVWPYEVAIEFDTPIEFIEEIAGWTEQQVKLGVIKR